MKSGMRTYIRWFVFVALAAFAPLPYFLAVVGGLIPYGGILLIVVNNLLDVSLLLLSLVHLAIYGVVLFGFADLIARSLMRFAKEQLWFATTVVLLALSCIGLMPIFGLAHGQIQWMNAYELYISGTLR